MSCISRAGRMLSILKYAENYLKISDRKISDFSKAIMDKNILPFEEYRKKHCHSLEQFKALMRPAFPEATDELFKKAYEDSCQSQYRTYKRHVENPDNNIGLMLTSDFFDDTANKEKGLSFDEFKKERCCSLEEYIEQSKSAFPEKTSEMFRKTYEKTCASRYRSYIKALENPGYNAGLMIDSYLSRWR